MVEVPLRGQLNLGHLQPRVDRLGRVGAGDSNRLRRAMGSGGTMKTWTDSRIAART